MEDSTTTLAPTRGASYTCLIDGCDWALTTDRAVPGQHVPGEPPREALIADHLSSHHRVQYVATIDRLRRELEALHGANT